MMRWFKNLFKKKKRQIDLPDVCQEVERLAGLTYWVPNQNEWTTIEPKPDFLPKKKMKVHKLDQHMRKQTFVRPGIYTMEVDYSFIPRRNRDE